MTGPNWYWNELRRLLPEVRGFTEQDQEALLDLTYNLGPYGLISRANLVAAAKRGDWESVAAFSHRRQVSADRNQEIAALFRTKQDQA